MAPLGHILINHNQYFRLPLKKNICTPEIRARVVWLKPWIILAYMMSYVQKKVLEFPQIKILELCAHDDCTLPGNEVNGLKVLF
jgi:hypothetical protein